LWARFNRGRDPSAREDLIRRYLPLARNLALRYRRGPDPLDDLLQEAGLALVKAVDRFDPERGVPFSAYAVPTILGELKRYFRDRGSTLRVPRPIHDRIGEVDNAITQLNVELQRTPSAAEIAAKLQIEPIEVLEAMDAYGMRHPLSLDFSPSEGTAVSMAEAVGADDEGFTRIEDRLAVHSALPELGPREQLVVRLRFGEDLTQAQIAERIGCSQMHVSRILRGALARIRQAVEDADS
jgi:RNA polymerase sigma-B factor